MGFAQSTVRRKSCSCALNQSRDGCDLTASFSQPTGVCCEKDSHSIFVVDSSSGRLRLITIVQVLIKYLQNLWLFQSAFNLIGTKTRLSCDETVTRVQPAVLCFSQIRSLIKSSRHQRLNFPDPRTRRDIICHHPELREDDPGRPLKTKDKGDGAQPELHSTRRR